MDAFDTVASDAARILDDDCFHNSCFDVHNELLSFGTVEDATAAPRSIPFSQNERFSSYLVPFSLEKSIAQQRPMRQLSVTCKDITMG